MNVNLVLDEGKVVRVTGPARITVKSGSVLLVGAIYGSNSQVIIHRLRSYAVKAIERSEVNVVLGSGASLEEPKEGEEVIDDWLKISEGLVKDTERVGKSLIVVVGPVESGKTTLTAFITNTLMRYGVKVGIIDADVGQEDIALPATIALAIPEKHFLWQRDLTPTEIRFVGCIAPQYCQDSIIAAVIDLVSSALSYGVSTVVINTDGWLNSHAALTHKLALIRWLKPTHVVVLDDEVFKYLTKSLPDSVRVIKAPRPTKVRERSREERRLLRAEAYRKYFLNAKERLVKINDIKLIYSNLVCGDTLGMSELARYLGIDEDVIKNNVLFASKYYNVLNIVINSESRDLMELLKCRRDVCVMRSDDIKGLLVGILNKRLKDVAVGIIKDVDFNEGIIKLLTPWNGEVSALVISKVKLSLDTFEDGLKVGRCIL